jgi:hypothetical protein
MKILSCTDRGNVILEATREELYVLRGYEDPDPADAPPASRQPTSFVGTTFSIPNRFQALFMLTRALRPLQSTIENGFQLMKLDRPADSERYRLAEADALHVVAQQHAKDVKRGQLIARARAEVIRANRALGKLIGAEMGTVEATSIRGVIKWVDEPMRKS